MSATPWPKVKFRNRHGMIEEGYAAHADSKETVVQVQRPPKMVPGPYGLKLSGTVYETVRNEFLITDAPVTAELQSESPKP